MALKTKCIFNPCENSEENAVSVVQLTLKKRCTQQRTRFVAVCAFSQFSMKLRQTVKYNVCPHGQGIVNDGVACWSSLKKLHLAVYHIYFIENKVS